MTVVVVLEDILSTECTDSALVQRITPGWGGDHTAELLELTAEAIGAGRSVISLYPTRRAEPARRAIRAVRSTLGTDRLAGVAVALPPLALSFVADFLAHAASYAVPGVVAGLATRLERELFAGAQLPSVTGLKHQPVSLRQHIRSLVPGTSFMSVAAPRPGVHSTVSAEALRRLGLHPPEPVHVITSGPAPGGSWISGTLLPALAPAMVRQLPPQPLSRAYWGTGNCTEFVAFCGRPDLLPCLVNSMRCLHCPWCGQVVTAFPCPFCAMSGLQSQDAMAAPVPAQNPTQQDGVRELSHDLTELVFQGGGR